MINLPLIIGHLVKNDDKNWNNFMNLKKIYRIPLLMKILQFAFKKI